MENFLIGAIGSLVASIFFSWLSYRHLRPRLLISQSIAKYINKDGVPQYMFKIINESPYPLIDVRTEIVLCTPLNIANGQVKHCDILQRSEQFHLDSLREQAERYGNEAYYTCSNLESNWNDDAQYVVFRVIARHSLSQFSRAFSQSYYRKGVSIKDGHFVNGPSLDVVLEGKHGTQTCLPRERITIYNSNGDRARRAQ